MHKNGLSDVVTVSLIILLAIAAVVIVWTFVRPTPVDVDRFTCDGLISESGNIYPRLKEDQDTFVDLFELEEASIEGVAEISRNYIATNCEIQWKFCNHYFINVTRPWKIEKRVICSDYTSDFNVNMMEYSEWRKEQKT